MKVTFSFQLNKTFHCFVAAATDEDATDVATATDETFDSVDATDATD